MNNKCITKHIVCWILVMLSAAVFAQEPQKKTIKDLKLFEQGVQLSGQGDWSGAEKIFREIAARHPSWPEPKNNLAVALYQSGKLEQAQQALEEAVTSLPSFKTAQSNRQRLYDYSATLAYYKAVGIDEKPDLPSLDLLREVKGSSSIVTRLAPAKSSGPAGDNDELVGQIKTSLLDWSESWSKANVDKYLSAYSSRFQPSEPFKDLASWRQKRRDKLRFTRIEQVSIDNIQVYLDADGRQALAEFVQHYQAENYQDRVLKQLRLAYENDRWLIRAERVLQQLN